MTTKKDRLLQTAKWEYKTLRKEMKEQGEDWEYEGGFEAWYKEVFLVDEAWAEIRANPI